jgi:hypothetical protein
MKAQGKELLSFLLAYFGIIEWNFDRKKAHFPHENEFRPGVTFLIALCVSQEPE